MIKNITTTILLFLFSTNILFCQLIIMQLMQNSDTLSFDSIDMTKGETLMGLSSYNKEEKDYNMMLFDFNEYTSEVSNIITIGEKNKLESVDYILPIANEEALIAYSTTVKYPYNSKAALLKLDKDKSILWSIELPNDKIRVRARKVIKKDNGEYIVLGSSSFSEMNTSFLYTISADGELISTKKIVQFQAFDCHLINTDEILLAGRIKKKKGYDAIIARVDMDGKILWRDVIDYGRVEAIQKIFGVEDSKFQVLVESESKLYHSRDNSLRVITYQGKKIKNESSLPIEGAFKQMKKTELGNYMLLAQGRTLKSKLYMNLLIMNNKGEPTCSEEISKYFPLLDNDGIFPKKYKIRILKATSNCEVSAKTLELE